MPDDDIVTVHIKILADGTPVAREPSELTWLLPRWTEYHPAHSYSVWPLENWAARHRFDVSFTRMAAPRSGNLAFRRMQAGLARARTFEPGVRTRFVCEKWRLKSMGYTSK